MSWADFYLICFVLGFVLSVISLAGAWDLHLPHFHLHFGGAHSHGFHGAAHGAEVAPINFGTVAAFLAWFGGTGYLFARFSKFWFLVALTIAGISGLIGAAAVFFFLAKFLMRRDEELDPADYEMVGVLGTISSTVRSSGRGGFEQDHRRCRRDGRANPGALRNAFGNTVHRSAFQDQDDRRQSAEARVVVGRKDRRIATGGEYGFTGKSINTDTGEFE